MGSLIIECGNIVDDKFLNKVDAIVNPTNPMMKYGSGVCGAIFEKADIDELETYTEQNFGIDFNNIDSANLMKVTEVRVTPGFRIPCNIIFAQGPKLWDYQEYSKAEELLLLTYKNILEFAESKGYKTILLPSMGTGVYGFEHLKVAKPVLNLLKAELKKINLNVIMVLREPDVAYLYQQLL